MPLSHAPFINSSTPSTSLEDLLTQVNGILKQARTEEFAALEQLLHQAFAEAERQCMQQLFIGRYLRKLSLKFMQIAL